MQSLGERLAGIRARIAEAARSSGRTADAVRLVAVTKYVDVEQAEALARAGCHDLGESRPQELWRKAGAWTAEPVRWHLIGHLQRNKIERTLPLVWMIHSADSLRLLDALEAAAAARQATARVLLEVNISGDATKHGFDPGEIEGHLPQLCAYRSLAIRGLMAMAAREGDLDQARREFAALRVLRERLQSAAGDQLALDELSMGMSGDYLVAIEEGATIVRIGSALTEDAP